MTTTLHSPPPLVANSSGARGFPLVLGSFCSPSATGSNAPSSSLHPKQTHSSDGGSSTSAPPQQRSTNVVVMSSSLPSGKTGTTTTTTQRQHHQPPTLRPAGAPMGPSTPSSHAGIVHHAALAASSGGPAPAGGMGAPLMKINIVPKRSPGNLALLQGGTSHFHQVNLALISPVPKFNLIFHKF